MKNLLVFFCIVLAVFALPSNNYAFNLSVTLNGFNGSVNSIPSGTIACTPQGGTCLFNLPAGTSLSLVAVPDIISYFGSWGGACSNCVDQTCPITMDSDKNCIVTFTTPPPVKLQSAYYSVLQDSFDAAANGSDILNKSGYYQENLTLKHPVSVAWRGGYDGLFSSRSGFTVLQGKLTVTSGKLVVDGIALYPPMPKIIDAQAPSIPAGLLATAVNWNSIDLAWTPSTDNIGVAGYEILRAGTIVGTTATTNFSDIGLAGSTEYCYSVVAYDGSGKISGQSAQSCATTQSGGLPSGTPVKVTLDSSGIVQSTITATGPNGSQLTLYAGTIVAVVGAGGDFLLPTSLNNIYLSLVDTTGTLPALPAGVTPLSQLRIVLTIDGAEANARFWPASNAGNARQGLQLSTTATNQNVFSGTLGLLFETSTGTAVRTGSSALTGMGTASPVPPASAASFAATAATSYSTYKMQFCPTSVGDYIIGGSPPGGTGSAPSAGFWSEFTVPDLGCINLGITQICGAQKVERVGIIEESTAEFLGLCDFVAGDTASTGILPPGYQFWCKRSRNPDGSTGIRIYSQQANLPVIKASIARESDGLPMWESYQKSLGGLHGPDGAVYADPYQSETFQFAGAKDFILTSTATTKDYLFVKKHSVQRLEQAGYTTSSFRYERTGTAGFIAKVSVTDTLDSRVLIEKNLTSGIWKVRNNGSDTQGNKGTYDYTPKYKGTVTFADIDPALFTPNYLTTAEVTFVKGLNFSPFIDDYDVSEGTIVHTINTLPYNPGGNCSATPNTFVSTYRILPEATEFSPGFAGWISIKTDVQPNLYMASGTINAQTGAYSGTPMRDLHYTLCCYNGVNTDCTDEVITVSMQEENWMNIPNFAHEVLPDGTLKGTINNRVGYLGYCDWNFTPVENSP